MNRHLWILAAAAAAAELGAQTPQTLTLGEAGVESAAASGFFALRTVRVVAHGANVARTRPIIKHVFEGVSAQKVRPTAAEMSVGCPIVSQQFDHTFYKSNI